MSLDLIKLAIEMNSLNVDVCDTVNVALNNLRKGGLDVDQCGLVASKGGVFVEVDDAAPTRRPTVPCGAAEVLVRKYDSDGNLVGEELEVVGIAKALPRSLDVRAYYAAKTPQERALATAKSAFNRDVHADAGRDERIPRGFDQLRRVLVYRGANSEAVFAFVDALTKAAPDLHMNAVEMGRLSRELDEIPTERLNAELQERARALLAIAFAVEPNLDAPAAERWRRDAGAETPKAESLDAVAFKGGDPIAETAETSFEESDDLLDEGEGAADVYGDRMTVASREQLEDDSRTYARRSECVPVLLPGWLHAPRVAKADWDPNDERAIVSEERVPFWTVELAFGEGSAVRTTKTAMSYEELRRSFRDLPGDRCRVVPMTGAKADGTPTVIGFSNGGTLPGVKVVGVRRAAVHSGACPFCSGARSAVVDDAASTAFWTGALPRQEWVDGVPVRMPMVAHRQQLGPHFVDLPTHVAKAHGLVMPEWVATEERPLVHRRLRPGKYSSRPAWSIDCTDPSCGRKEHGAPDLDAADLLLEAACLNLTSRDLMDMLCLSSNRRSNAVSPSDGSFLRVGEAKEALCGSVKAFDRQVENLVAARRCTCGAPMKFVRDGFFGRDGNFVPRLLPVYDRTPQEPRIEVDDRGRVVAGPRGLLDCNAEKVDDVWVVCPAKDWLAGRPEIEAAAAECRAAGAKGKEAREAAKAEILRRRKDPAERRYLNAALNAGYREAALAKATSSPFVRETLLPRAASMTLANFHASRKACLSDLAAANLSFEENAFVKAFLSALRDELLVDALAEISRNKAAGRGKAFAELSRRVGTLDYDQLNLLDGWMNPVELTDAERFVLREKYLNRRRELREAALPTAVRGAWAAYLDSETADPKQVRRIRCAASLVGDRKLESRAAGRLAGGVA